MNRLFLVWLTLIVVGCNGPWETQVNSDPVWCGPQMRVEMQRRDLNDLTERLSEKRWLCDGDSVGSLNNIDIETIDYLEEIGLLASWPSRGKNLGCGRSRNPPYRLYMVSINPRVLLMVKKRTEFERGPVSGQIMRDCRLDGPIEFGTNFECGGEILWFSPDEKVGPLPLENYDARIVLPDGHIQLIRQDDRFRVERL